MMKVILSSVLWLCLSFAAVGQSSVTSTHSTATLVSEVESLVPGKPFWLGLHLEPIDEWHIYWENPGDSGAATSFDWQVEGDFSFDKALYPVPHKLPYDPLLNYGFEGPSTLLVRVVPPKQIAGLTTITLDAEWLVCKVECIPQFGTFTIDLPLGDGTKIDANKDLFAAARDALPEPGYWGAELSVNGGESLLTVFLSDDEIADVANASYFPREGGVTEYAAPQIVEIAENGLLIRLKRFAGDVMPASGDGVLVVDQLDGSTIAADLIGVPIVDPTPVLATASQGASSPNTQAQASFSAILAAIGGAFLGGLILNLMPCVFPVLSLKAFAVIQGGGLSDSERKAEAWAYTAGILSSFLVVVGALVALREGGTAVGWGFQLQSPLFLALMAVLMTLLGLSMAGMFDITTGFDDAGQGLASQGGKRGAFFTGVLATLVATPCTGPFMATAIGFAMAQPLPILLTIFLMLGFGLAFPFLLLSYSPRLAKLLPRPGGWMETVKQALSFPLFLTAAALLWVFTGVAGADAMLQLLAAIIGVIFAIWLLQQGQAIWLKGGAAIVAVFALYGVYGSADLSGYETNQSADAAQPQNDNAYSAELLAASIGGDQPVFAYFTADWCITCKVNERVALFREETQDHFQSLNVKIIKGDWTNRNAEIAEILEEYGRAGVPMYLYFPAGSTEAVILPEVLTVGIIKKTVS